MFVSVFLCAKFVKFLLEASKSFLTEDVAKQIAPHTQHTNTHGHKKTNFFVGWLSGWWGCEVNNFNQRPMTNKHRKTNSKCNDVANV